MVLQNGKSEVVRIWGGYGPKLHDGSWLEVHKEELLHSLRGSCICGDNHFSRGRALFKNKIKFHTNYTIREGTREERNCEDEEFVSNEEYQSKKKYNASHQKARARVEQPFGDLELKYASLRKPWAESEEQLDCLIYTAFAIRNCQKAKSN